MRRFLLLAFAPLLAACGSSSDSSGSAGAAGAPATSLRQSDGTCDPAGEWEFALEAGGQYPQCNDLRFFLSGVSIRKNDDGSFTVDPAPYLVATNPPDDTTVVFSPDHCTLEIQLTTSEDPTQDDSPTVGVDVSLDLSTTPSTGTYGFEAPADCGNDESLHLVIDRKPSS